MSLLEEGIATGNVLPTGRKEKHSIDNVTRDFDIYRIKCDLLFYNDLQSKGLSEEVSLAEFVGLCSAACNRPVMPALAIPGILRMSGSMDEIRGLEDIMRVAKNAGAKRVILPLSAIAGLQSVSSEIISGLSPVFYMDGDPVDAAKKALDL